VYLPSVLIHQAVRAVTPTPVLQENVRYDEEHGTV